MDRGFMRRTITFLSMLLLAACGTSAGQSEPSTVQVAASEFRFSPAALTLTAGQATTLRLKNAGQTLHDFTIVSGPGISTPEPGTSGASTNTSQPYHVAAEGGAQATLTLNLAPGTYTFICSVAGHKELGMTGTIVVQ